MLSLNPDNIYDVAQPLHFCSRLIGLTSFSIRRKNEKFVDSVTAFNLLCIVFSTLWNIFIVFLFVMKTHEMWIINHVYISHIFEPLMFCVILGFLVVSMISNWWTFMARNYFASIINKFVTIDNELCEMKVSVNLKRQKSFILVFVFITKVLTCSSIIVVDLLGKHYDVFKNDIFFSITIYVCIEMWIFINCQFIFLMWSVKLRFEKINLYLAKTFLEPRKEIIKDGIDKLTKAFVCHDKIVDITESINRCYGIPVCLFIKISSY